MDDIFSKAADDVLSGGQTEPPAIEIQPKRARRSRAKPAAQEPAAIPASGGAKEAAGMGLGIPQEQLEAAIGPFLRNIAKLSKTTPPDPVEISGMAQNLSFGLANTKIGAGENSGPWTPFLLMLTLYSFPRGLEYLFRVIDERAEKRDREEAARRGRLVGTASMGATDRTVPSQANAGKSTSADGPVPAIGAITDR